MMVVEKRPRPSPLWRWAAPLLAIVLAVMAGAVMFALLGHDPLVALHAYFIEPLTSAWSLEELVVKATPLTIIGAGLAFAYRANVWNIGAEGQLAMGAIAGSLIPILLPGWNDPLALVAMLALGRWAGRHGGPFRPS
jgi:simple sugar transport system permease protein